MPTFSCSQEIKASASQLFTLTQDYTHRLEWDPFLREARLVDASQAAVGVRAWCVDHRGLGMETEYVTVSPPNVAAVKMTMGPRLLERFAASWRFDELTPDTTMVTFRYHITTRPAWLRFLADPLCAFAFRVEMRQRLAALKHAVETTDILEVTLRPGQTHFAGETAYASDQSND